MKGENKMELTKDEKFYVLVAGSRTFTDYELMKSKLDKLLINHNDVVVVSGGARGADTLAERYAKEKGYIFANITMNTKEIHHGINN